MPPWGVALTLLTLGAISLFLLSAVPTTGCKYNIFSSMHVAGLRPQTTNNVGQLHRRPLAIPRRRWHGSTLLSYA